MGKVLLVEDHEELNEINRRALEMCGHEVCVAENLERARSWLAGNEPDVILLDVLLPDGDGVEFCAEIRGRTHAHILFLTSRAEHTDKIRGLMLGGDDYITKPYNPDELLARVAAAIRRREMTDVPHGAREKTKGPLRLDIVSMRAYIHDVDIGLTSKEFSLLLVLLEKLGQPVSADTLYKAVWNQPAAGDGNALWTHMSRLRKKLEGGSRLVTLKTSRREGYCLEIEENGL